MSLLLCTSRSRPRTDEYDAWCAAPGASARLPEERRVAGLAAQLEAAFDAERETWARLAADVLAKEPSSLLAHAPSLAANASDFGLMLAWRRLAADFAAADRRTLLVCDDPWLFRALAALPNVRTAAPAPGLSAASLKLALRGFLARSAVAGRVALTSWRLRHHRRRAGTGGAWLIVYGHPRSSSDGVDAYFGELMLSLGQLRRAVHVDAPLARAESLSGNRTQSLHAWGRLMDAVSLPFARWRADASTVAPDLAWLVRRAVALEGGTGQAAMIAWQIRCQRRWLDAAQPETVAWPWENHGWERDFVRAARAKGVTTMGYVHVPVYWREWNYMPSGDAVTRPDRLVVCGDAARRSLIALGHDEAAVETGGAFRFATLKPIRHDSNGPLFVAVPATASVAREMIEAVRPIADSGRLVLIRDHPLAPISFEETPTLRRASGPLQDQDGIAAVLYASTSVGLEALLAGLPTLRFLPTSTVGQGLPGNLGKHIADVDAAALRSGFTVPPAPPALVAGTLFAAPDIGFWQRLLGAAGTGAAAPESGLCRKFRQLAGDPVLRRWLIARARRRQPAPPPFHAHRPPYVAHLLPLTAETPSLDAQTLPAHPLEGSLVLDLPGARIDVMPEDVPGLFRRAFADIETRLALHRFAWLPGLDPETAQRWMPHLWKVWRDGCGTPTGDWPWHPYTAAERAINVLDFVAAHGSPGDPVDVARDLAAHAPAIAAKLEYFGEHDTSNHLANDGRGLHALGIRLGMPKAAELGTAILLAEAERIFRPSGVLREGSTHYHALLTRNYGRAAMLAASAGRPEAGALAAIAMRGRNVHAALTLTGGTPLIGDISPDATPADVFADLGAEGQPADAEALAADGWHRVDAGPWSTLIQATADGWSFMPGHGHADTGAFETHFAGVPLFLDPGRGGYGESGDAALYRSGRVHNVLTVGGADPYPSNKPYYTDGFRKDAAPPPLVGRTSDGLELRHHGFARIGVGAARRSWRFSAEAMHVEDSVEGAGAAVIERAFCTPLAAELRDGAVVLSGDCIRLRLTAEAGAEIVIERAARWTAYGAATPATFIRIRAAARLPWRGGIEIERI